METTVAISKVGVSRKQTADNFRETSLLGNLCDLIELTDWDERLCGTKWVDKICFIVIVISIFFLIPVVWSIFFQ
ncbi:MAG: hypothetical protein M0P57_04275 [Syntrophales bacterium]|nr:hypothetical protein [Syntrophales bacterium]MDY0044192.1 hypothetical protein [Syntrophales bacterium]